MKTLCLLAFYYLMIFNTVEASAAVNSKALNSFKNLMVSFYPNFQTPIEYNNGDCCYRANAYFSELNPTELKLIDSSILIKSNNVYSMKDYVYGIMPFPENYAQSADPEFVLGLFSQALYKFTKDTLDSKTNSTPELELYLIKNSSFDQDFLLIDPSTSEAIRIQLKEF